MKKILVLGGSGLVGSNFIQSLSSNYKIFNPTHQELDVLNKEELISYLEKIDFEILINFVGFTNVEAAEDQKGDTQGMAFAMNATLPHNLAEYCLEHNKKLIHLSTDYVFNGKNEHSYKENEKKEAINWYGQTKLYGEQFILESGCKYLITRIVMPYNAYFEKKKDIARFFVEQLKNNKPVIAIGDQKVTPTFIPDITKALKILIDSNAEGIYHLASTDPITPFDFANLLAQEFGLDKSLITTISLEEYNNQKKASLLKNSALDTSKFIQQFGEQLLHSNAESIHLFKMQVDSLKKD